MMLQGQFDVSNKKELDKLVTQSIKVRLMKAILNCIVW